MSSNLPPGVTDADIDEAAGAFDINVLHWLGPGNYRNVRSDNSHNAGRGRTNHWERVILQEESPDDQYIDNPKTDWGGIVVFPEHILLALCEPEHITLRAGVPYVFYKVPGCKRCEELAATYDHEKAAPITPVKS